MRPCSAILLATVVLACGDATDPGDDAPKTLTLGDTVSGSINRAETDIFTMAVTESLTVAVFLQVLDSNLAMVQAGNGIVNPSIRATYVQRPGLSATRTPHLDLLPGQTLTVRVGPIPGGNPQFELGRYRFLVYRVNRGPETASAALGLGDSIAGETLENSADIDEWVLSTHFSDTTAASVWLGAGAGATAGGMVATLRDGDVGQVAVVSGADTSTVRSGFFYSGFGDRWLLTVRSPDPASFTLTAPVLPAYRLGTSASDLAPETVPTFPVVGDTITGEAIDSVGDVDTYLGQFAPAPDGYVAFVQLLAGQSTDSLVLVDPYGPASVTSRGGDSTLFGQSTGVFYGNGPPPLSWRWAVRGHPSAPGSSPLPYRLAVFRRSGAPESVPLALAPGDTVQSEAIDYPGDFDGFQVTATDTTLNFQVEVPAAFGAAVRVDVVQGANGYGTWLPPAGTTLDAGAITARLPAPGTYTIRIASHVAGHYGGYRLLLN